MHSGMTYGRRHLSCKLLGWQPKALDKKIRNNMYTLGERIQEYGVRISSFDLFQLNNSTSQHLNILVFPYPMALRSSMVVYFACSCNCRRSVLMKYHDRKRTVNKRKMAMTDP